MNDAGNFLIETCDETISRDLKQQLLLLNGRWRELFMQVKNPMYRSEGSKQWEGKLKVPILSGHRNLVTGCNIDA